VPDTLVSSDLNLSRSPLAGPAFGCTLTDEGSGAIWVRTVGELNHATAPQLASMLSQATRLARIVVVYLRGLPGVERVLALTAGASHAIEIVDLAAGEPLVLTLLQIALNDRAGVSPPSRVCLDVLRAGHDSHT
jgi:hypothetical protein